MPYIILPKRGSAWSVPTYATWNPADKDTDCVLSNGNLTIANGNWVYPWRGARATVGKSAGKWYWEYTFTLRQANSYTVVGVGTSSATLVDHVGADAHGWGYYGEDGSKVNSDSMSAYGTAFTLNDVIGVALDMDSGKVWFSKNGTWQNSGDPAAGTGEAFSGISGTVFPMIVPYDVSEVANFTANFGASALTYPPPAGFASGMYN